MLGREHAIGHPALTDESSGLANRLHFELVYSYLFHVADRGVPLTLMLITTPTPTPDAMRAVGERIQDMTRSADLVAHLGNGRFIITLMGCNLSGARIAADRIETALVEVATGSVTIGLASYHEEMREPTDLLQAVAEALSQAEGPGGGLGMMG
jgi:GGDEF domain-containing protein